LRYRERNYLDQGGIKDWIVITASQLEEVDGMTMAMVKVV
jgi:hypothetical protein